MDWTHILAGFIGAVFAFLLQILRDHYLRRWNESAAEKQCLHEKQLAADQRDFELEKMRREKNEKAGGDPTLYGGKIGGR